MRYSLVAFLFLISSACKAQQYNVPLNHQYYQWVGKSLNNNPDTFFHTGCKPYIAATINFDTIGKNQRFNWPRKQRNRWFSRKLWNEAFIKLDTGNFQLRANPLFNLEAGKDFSTAQQTRELYYTNTRGTIVQGSIGTNFSFETSFYENQAFFPNYVNNYVAAYAEEYHNGATYVQQKNFGLVPGQGRAKPFKDGGFDYAMASGYISYSPCKQFNVQAGHGKHFIGDGYRSMLLSDNTFNYPYVKFTTHLWKNRLQYTNIYAQLQSLRRVVASDGPEAPFETKFATFHYLSFIPHKMVEIGLFEGIMWQQYDFTGSRPLDKNYLVPLIGLNTGINGFNANNNALTGATAKLLPIENIKIYGQFAFDDNSKNAYQAGVTLYDGLGFVKSLNLLAEFNSATKYSYKHSELLQSYSHYNQPLAHPSGASFNEIVTQLSYNYRNLFLNIRYIVGNQSTNCLESSITENCNYGADTTQTYFGAYNNGYMANVEVSYLINPMNNMQFTIGITSAEKRQANYVYFAFRTALTNRYYDF